MNEPLHLRFYEELLSIDNCLFKEYLFKFDIKVYSNVKEGIGMSFKGILYEYIDTNICSRTNLECCVSCLGAFTRTESDTKAETDEMAIKSVLVSVQCEHLHALIHKPFLSVWISVSVNAPLIRIVIDGTTSWTFLLF